MIMISMMTAGILSTVYFGTCFYYLIKSDNIYLGEEFTYPKLIFAPSFMTHTKPLSVIEMSKVSPSSHYFKHFSLLYFSDNYFIIGVVKNAKKKAECNLRNLFSLLFSCLRN